VAEDAPLPEQKADAEPPPGRVSCMAIFKIDEIRNMNQKEMQRSCESSKASSSGREASLLPVALRRSPDGSETFAGR